MAEVEIEDVVRRLSDSTSTARKEALDDLKIILQQSKGISRADSLGDEGFHQIYEALFRSVRIERTAYVSSSRSSKSSNAANRLRDGASVFRLAVELGVREITSKTANAVVDHIIDTLPVTGEAYCQPLTDDYLKILRAILECAAHVEHLRGKKWRTLVDFLIQGISHYALEEEGTPSGTNSSSQHSRHGRITSFRFSQPSGSRPTRYEAGRPAEDLFFCLDRLTSVTNAPTMSRATQIVDCMIQFFNSTASSSSLHQIAFNCVNNVMAKLITEDSRFAQMAVLDIIPTIRRLWSSKNLLLRDEMLITLVLSGEIIKALPKTDPSDEVQSSVSNLLEVMSAEYSRRNERDILQLEDISFINDHAQQVMSLDSFRIRADNTRGTFNWATISVLSFLTLTVDRFFEIVQQDETNDTTSKRPKLTNWVDETLRQSLSASTSTKARALQIVPFLLKDSKDASDRFVSFVVDFTNQILDEDPTVSAWTMIAISRQVSLLSVEVALKPELKPQWLQIWHLTSRNLSNANVSRPAAHLLDSILNSTMLQNTDKWKLIDRTLFSDGLNGPVGLSDAALSLWSSIIRSRIAGGQSAAQQIVIRLVTWLSSYYTLAPGIDRVFSKQMAATATPAAILNLLLLCTNAQVRLHCVDRPVISSSIFVIAFQIDRNAGLSQYLIEGKAPPKLREGVPPVERTIDDDDPRARDTSSDHVIVEMLLTKLQTFKEAWLALSKERASNVSADIIQVMMSLIVIGSIWPTLLGTEQSQNCKELVHSARQVWALVDSFIEISGEAESDHATIAAATLTALRSFDGMLARRPVSQGLAFMLPSLLKKLHGRKDTGEEMVRDDIDNIEIRDSCVSYGSQGNSDRLPTSATRLDLPFATEMHQFKREAMLQLRMSVRDVEAASVAEEHDVESIIDYLTSLGPEDLLASRSSIVLYLRSSNLSRSEACRLLKSIAHACIQDYEFERCEASLCLCLEVMIALAELWVTDDEDELHEVASDMYEWFIKVQLGKELASTRLLIKLAELLQTTLNLNPKYNNASLPSSRTSLFEILRTGSNVVKFHVADRISRIFEWFILTEHTAILNDVVESLPKDSTDLDGIALRLYVLAELAARWATLLRPSVYHIFETSAHVSRSMPHAQSCLQTISSALSLGSPRNLFMLFAPQLLYVWLETESLESVPFSIYGYGKLSELITEVQDEVIGQIVMRANKGLADRISAIMEVPFDVMLETSFPKAEAYSVARDISMPPSKDNAFKSTESQVRKQLGTDKYLRLVSFCFPRIVSHLFISLSDEHEMERALTKRPEFAFAATNLQSICRLSSSRIVLPAGQQPSFRAKYLLDELEFLCQRIGKDHLTVWNPPLIVYVCRTLLDTVVPALGPLHACGVLRKIRIVVALAGQESLQGYALEMLLQALHPYLTRFYCAEDALGLFWFLLEGGRSYLQQNLAFLCRIALTALLSLSAFLKAPQDSTTQESHYLSTLSIAASFHKWFQTYLADFPDQTHLVEDASTFKLMISYAGDARPPGRADNDSVEGRLLLELLEARTSDRKILSPATFKMAIQMLCNSFIRPAKPEEDILGQDDLAVRHARVLWALLGEMTAPPEFWIWSGESLGRAYAASGVIHPTLTMEHSQNLFPLSDLSNSSSRTSRSLILDDLQDLLHSDNYCVVSSAEATLQHVITQVADQRALDEYEDCIDLALVRALNWHPAPPPKMTAFQEPSPMTDEHLALNYPVSASSWASRFLVSLTTMVESDPLLGALSPILSKFHSLAIRLMPFVVHNFLGLDNKDGQSHRQIVSQAFSNILMEDSASLAAQRRLVLSTLLYLRSQPLRKEVTIADRSAWLNIDFGTAAEAASSCAMFKSALLLLELQASQQSSQSSRASRRSSLSKVIEAPNLMRQIYQSLDDPDFFYGMQEEASLHSVMRKLSHERNSLKNLSFQSAAFDSGIKVSEVEDRTGLLDSFVSANMNGVARAVQAQLTPEIGQRTSSTSSASLTALNLHQWDIPVSSTASDPSSLLFQVFRGANTSLNFADVPRKIDGALLTLAKNISHERADAIQLRQSMSALAALTETREALSSRSTQELETYWQKLASREEWQETENFDDLTLILAGREALYSSIKKQKYLATAMRLDPVDCQMFELKCVRHSLKLARSHADLQPALNRALYLSSMVKDSAALGLVISGAVSYDFAGVLWDQGDMTASIQMLKQLKNNSQGEKQAIFVSRPTLLAEMGRHIADARLEKPDEIITNYLLPAIKELKGKGEGREAGQVYHEFASFCDRQLQSADGMDEFSRVEKIRQQKEAEVKDLERMVHNAQGKLREQLASHHAKAKQWYKLDDAEYQRLKRTRESFLLQTLENYLLSLRACDDYANDVLRFCAMWLDNSGNETANIAVGKLLAEVASRKFVPLMNQLSSRLQDSTDDFQEHLFDLLLRICQDHPFHGMYQIFASSKSKGGKDDLALSRHAAANRLSEELRKGPASSTWVAVHNSNISFIRFALDHLPDDNKHKSGSKVPLAKISSGQKLVQEILNLTTKIPPPTLKIPIRIDCDYRSVPVLKHFEPTFTVAGGVSAPKIITILASDGSRMKALLKGGNDDLRQDSIMEQVFEQVSNLLKDHRETRQRQLGIRTYKVLPLTMNAGIIEFVSNTIPLHEFSLPAHQKYFPKDWKPNKCRKEIADAQSKSLSTRIQVYRNVCANFQPVLRHFFFERFLNPDEWFIRRLAYSRSTAAISILGHVLGLGDRHGHNILLDERTGEVVHIDLGVAFEAGRVLPVPEVVPFRLTRDIIDGMGLSGVEGVFRRCCNFTLEALRQDQYSIMTILDVLRYDPLYSWSISPLRLQRMQESKKLQQQQQQGEEERAGQDAAAGTGIGMTALANKKAVNNPSEADRALTVVARKLGKSLSVEATVNELIQQAVDERNLAVLYCGWAAYA